MSKKKKGKKGKKGKKNKGRKMKKKGKKERKTKKTKQSQTTSECNSDEACLTAVAKYMNQYNTKYRNFDIQRKRISKFEKLATNKGGKKDVFKSIKGQIQEVGGGNASALSCGGQSTGTGPELLKSVFDQLSACSGDIMKACETNKPAINQTFIKECMTKIVDVVTVL